MTINLDSYSGTVCYYYFYGAPGRPANLHHTAPIKGPQGERFLALGFEIATRGTLFSPQCENAAGAVPSALHPYRTDLGSTMHRPTHRSSEYTVYSLNTLYYGMLSLV